jgi:zinc protease
MTLAVHRGLSPVRAVLDNGAVITAKQTPTTPAVTIHLGFLAGSVYDPAAATGLAHFVSRVIDRGTRTRSAAVLAEELDRRGVSLSTMINRHVLALICTCLVEDLPDVLALVADIAMNPVFPDEEAATKRGEVVTLIRQDEDNPAVMATEGLLHDLYGPHHGYGRRPRGTVETVGSISAEALRRFHADRIRPSVMSLVLVGDIDPLQAIDAGRRAFEGWAAPVAADVRLATPVPDATRRMRTIPMMNKAQTDIAYGFISIRRSDPAYYGYWLLNNILGQYAIGGRLGDSIRERQGMAYYVFSALDANLIPGPLMVRAGVSPENVERAIASIDAEVSQLASEGPTDRELTESRQYLIWSMPRTLETNLGIASFLQTSEFFGLGPDYDLRVPGLLHAVSRDAVHDAARQALDPQRATIVVAGPYSGRETTQAAS